MEDTVFRLQNIFFLLQVSNLTEKMRGRPALGSQVINAASVESEISSERCVKTGQVFSGSTWHLLLFCGPKGIGQ